MFLIDIPFKGCHGRSSRSWNVHAVSYFACGVNDTAETNFGDFRSDYLSKYDAICKMVQVNQRHIWG
jgi:hypothetical protein